MTPKAINGDPPLMLAAGQQGMRSHKICNRHWRLLLPSLTCLMIAAINAARHLRHKSKDIQWNWEALRLGSGTNSSP